MANEGHSTADNDRDKPLEGLRVIDASNLIAAPFGTSILADFGADVITVEHPEYGDEVRNLKPQKDDISLWWKLLARNKRAVTLNLSESAGSAVFMDLVRDADVVVESFRPGTMERWGIGPDDFREVNPELIMLRLTGFGQTGPYNEKPGFGRIAGAISGMTHLIGEADGPPVEPSFPIEDLIAGTFGALGVIMAVFNRDVGGGGGQVIDLSLYEPLFRLLSITALEYDQLQEVPKRNGNNHPYIAPNSIFETGDEEFVMLPPSTQSTWRALCRAMDAEELISDPRFETNEDRVDHSTEINDIVASWVGEHSRPELEELFEAHDVPYSFVYDIEDIFGDEHYEARNDLTSVADGELGEAILSNVVPKFSETPGQVEHLGPPAGSANEEVYGHELGYSEERLDELRSHGII